MAATERPVEGTFNGTTAVSLGGWPGGSVITSTLLSFHTLSDQSADRELTIYHDKASTLSYLEKKTIIGTSTGAKSPEIGCPVGAINAADEDIKVVLDGAGTFRWQAVWLDREP